jgi:hypothetical protein
LLAQPATLDAYDWGLVVSLIVEADDALMRARAYESSITLPLLETILDELRDVTSNFTNAAFLEASKSARRQKTGLFAVRR